MDLKKPFRLDGIYRVDDTPVHVAVREALANCLSNADYYLPECVKIEKYPDRIVLTNPGTITLGKKQMLRGGKSRPRNKVVLNILNYIGVGERAGSGVPNIYAIWEQEGYLEPTVEEMSGREGPITTVVTLPLVKKEQNDHNQDLHLGEEKGEEKGEETREEVVIDMIRNNPQVSMAAISRETGLTKRQVEKTLITLKANRRIHREGPDKGGKWIID